MADYIEIPLETNPEAISAEGFDFVQAQIPGWLPNDANLETIIIEAVALMTADARDAASAVTYDIFRAFGKLVDILPIEASYALATVAFAVINNAGYTIPAGTQIGIVITGDDIVGFETTTDTVIAPGSTTATGVPVQAVEKGSDSSGLSATLTASMLDPLDYVTLVDLEINTYGGVDAEDDAVYLNRLAGRLQLMTQHPILANDFAVYALDIAGVARAVALDGYNPDHNLLTLNQSSLETDTTGWVAETNVTIARDTTQAAHGTANLRMTATAAADMFAITTPTNTYTVSPGQQITALASFRANTTGRSCRVELSWYDASSIFISSTIGANVSDTNAGWIQAFVTGNAPANAAFVRVRVKTVAPGAAEVHYVDKIALKHTPSQTWNVGGTPESGNERYVTVALIDELGQPVSVGVKNNVDAYLESLREVNFIVEEIDPQYTTIDVQFTAVARSGYVASEVKASAEAAVTAYLSPVNWGVPNFPIIGDSDIGPFWTNQTVIRIYELATVINEVPGIDYITAGTLQIRISGGTFGVTDITIGGPAPLPLSGTVTATVT